MHIRLFSLLAVFFALISLANAETTTFTENLSVGSKGAQVTALQQLLNTDAGTRVADVGPGSPGQETAYFGSFTKVAVIKFQEKYASEVLSPAGLAKGSGYVGTYTRAKLNTLVVPKTVVPVALLTATTTATSTPADPAAAYRVKEYEKTDIYAGDKLLENMQNKIYSAIDAAVASRGAEALKAPDISAADIPSVSIASLSPREATAGARVSISGSGITSGSVIYLGNGYIVRAISQDILGNLSFVVPPIPLGRYDLAVKTGGAISNTTSFVIREASGQTVRLSNVSPIPVRFGAALTITGSGFSRSNNVVITTGQTMRNVPSADGTTLNVEIAPATYREVAKLGNGGSSIPMTVSVVSDYGFSTNELSFDLAI